MTAIEQTVVENVLEEFSNLTQKLEKFLRPQEEKSENIKSVIKNLYDFTKLHEKEKLSVNVLPELIVQDFDDEQIWQEIELQNNFKWNQFTFEIAHLIAKKDKLHFLKAVSDGHISQNEEGEGNTDIDKNDSCYSVEEESDSSSNKSVSFDEREESMKSEKNRSFKPSVVDDQFFKLREMEEYLEKMEEKKSGNESEESIDMFADIESESEMSEDEDNDEKKQPFYSDFFDQPLTEEKVPNKILKRKKTDSNEKSVSPTKSVNFDLRENKMEYSDGEESRISNEFDNSEMSAETNVKSSFELRQERLKLRIQSLEQDALKEKPWQLKGEVSARSRPENSLLEEYVEFDLTSRPPPIITEQTTLKLEDIITQRIKDKAWDDVVRKIKPVEEPHEYRKKLILDQEKSKASLAEIYEQEFIKQRDATNPQVQDKPEEIPAEHIEIQNMMKKLFTKLDALSNFHYTPKQVAPDIKIISNLPAITMEEVAPVSVSDATLLAPEEIKAKSKGDIIGKKERTVTDKKRDRRQKKIKQRLREKEREKKKKIIEKLHPGLGNKYSKEKASKYIEKAIKEGSNVSKTDDTSDMKSFKSSKAFFTQLNDEVSNHIKAKSKLTEKKKKDKLNIKKLKI